MAPDEIEIPDGVESTEDLTAEQLEEMDQDELVKLVQSLQSQSGGPEEITNTSAHQLAFARAILDELVVDGEQPDGVLVYSPDGEVPEGVEEREVLAVFTNSTIESKRRDAWFVETYMWLVDAVSGDDDEKFRAAMSENFDTYAEIVSEASRESIKDALDARGHPVPETEDEPNAVVGLEVEVQAAESEEDEESPDEEADEE